MAFNLYVLRYGPSHFALWTLHAYDTFQMGAKEVYHLSHKP